MQPDVDEGYPDDANGDVEQRRQEPPWPRRPTRSKAEAGKNPSAPEEDNPRVSDAGVEPIPRKANERRGGRFDRAVYRERNRIERLIRRLKRHRAIATRDEKLEVTYHAPLTLACILRWL